MSMPARLVLVDDHPIVLSGLRRLIESASDLAIVGEATSGATALTMIRERNPDVAVVDISMPDMNGIALSKKLAEECPTSRILVLTFREEYAYVHQAQLAGVRGYVLKRSAADSLISAIRVIWAGGVFLDPALSCQGATGAASETAPGLRKPPSQMTDREAEVVKLVALGFTNKEIGSQLGVSVKTVETYKARAAEKAGLRTRADIVRYASSLGWLAGV
jgi:DNA-binding NarL/FixJ family response regulator